MGDDGTEGNLVYQHDYGSPRGRECHSIHQVSIKYFFTWNLGQFRAVLARIADRRECSR